MAQAIASDAHAGQRPCEGVSSSECGGQWVERDLDALALDIVQPAFGLDLEGGNWKGFPPGAFVLQTALQAGLFSWGAIALNTETVWFQSYPGWIGASPEGGFKVFFDIQCGGDVKPIEATLSFQTSSALEGPPVVGIYDPGPIACPDDVVFTLAYADDPDEDLASLRWVVDGVLLEDTWPTVTFTESHEVRAILRDSRGATTTATRTIDCE